MYYKIYQGSVLITRVAFKLDYAMFILLVCFSLHYFDYFAGFAQTKFHALT